MDAEDATTSDEKPSHSKLSRKIGEKLRRDRLNGLITELAEEIPMVKYAHRRLDKSAILRLTVNYLKLNHGLKQMRTSSQVNSQEVGILNWLRKITDDALLIIAEDGNILYVSNKITEMTGFYQTDMIGYNIERFVHPADVQVVMSRIQVSPDSSNACSATFKPTHTGVEKPKELEIKQSDHNYFYVRMLRSQKKQASKGGEMEYELMTIKTFSERSMGTKSEVWMIALLKPFKSESVAEVQVHMSEFMKNNEFASMHDLDSVIVAVDQRASLFHGYLASELKGRTPYVLIYHEDLESVAVNHKIIMKEQEITSTVYRMNNCYSIQLYVQSRSIIVKDKWTKKPKCIVSVNTVLDYDTGRKLLSKQKKETDAFKALEYQKTAALASESTVTEDGSVIANSECPSEGAASTIEDSNLEIHKQTGKSLQEIYEEQAKSIPELYDDSSSSGLSVLAEKRAFECVDEDSQSTDVPSGSNDTDSGAGNRKESSSCKICKDTVCSCTGSTANSSINFSVANKFIPGRSMPDQNTPEITSDTSPLNDSIVNSMPSNLSSKMTESASGGTNSMLRTKSGTETTSGKSGTGTKCMKGTKSTKVSAKSMCSREEDLPLLKGILEGRVRMDPATYAQFSQLDIENITMDGQSKHTGARCNTDDSQSSIDNMKSAEHSLQRKSSPQFDSVDNDQQFSSDALSDIVDLQTGGHRQQFNTDSSFQYNMSSCQQLPDHRHHSNQRQQLGNLQQFSTASTNHLLNTDNSPYFYTNVSIPFSTATDSFHQPNINSSMSFSTENSQQFNTVNSYPFSSGYSQFNTVNSQQFSCESPQFNTMNSHPYNTMTNTVSSNQFNTRNSHQFNTENSHPFNTMTNTVNSNQFNTLSGNSHPFNTMTMTNSVNSHQFSTDTSPSQFNTQCGVGSQPPRAGNTLHNDQIYPPYPHQDHTQQLAASAPQDDVQSPTVDSSDPFNTAGDLLSSQGATEFMPHLLSKYNKMKDIFANQMSMIQVLQSQIVETRGNSRLDSSQGEVHDTLVGRLSEVESQMCLQKKLLVELEAEIREQK